MSDANTLSLAQPDTITLVESFHQEVRSEGADVSLNMKRTGQRPDVELLPDMLGIDVERLTINNVSQTSDAPGCLITGGMLVAALGGVPLYFWTDSLTWTVIPIMSWIAGIVAFFLILRRPEFAAYVSVRCDDADRVHELVAKVGEHRNINLSATQWRYEVDAEVKGDWSEQCIVQARARAERIAEALSVKIIGVHNYYERFQLPHNTHNAQPIIIEAAQAGKSRGGFSWGGGGYVSQSVPMQSAERSGAEIVVEFRIEPLGSD